MADQRVGQDYGLPTANGALPRPLASVSPAVLALGLLTLGAGMRLVHFLGGRSLWLDEAYVALNIIHLPFEQLTGQLHFDQLAPVGWLVLQKGLLTLWPDFDYSLRVTALVFSLGGLALYWKLVEKALPPAGALFALGLFAIAPPLNQYASMVKPYIVDVFFSIALTYCALSLLEREGRQLIMILILGAVGLVAIAFSFPAVIVMAPIGIILSIRALRGGNVANVILLAVVGLCWLALFATLYFGVYQQQSVVIDNMKTIYWKDAFAPWPPRSLTDLAWYPKSIMSAVHWFIRAPGQVTIVLLAVGAYTIARRHRWFFGVLAGTNVTAVLLSASEAYPFESRFVLYLAPQFLILIAAGVLEIARQCRHYGFALATLCLVVAAAAAAHSARATIADPPWPMEEIKPHLAHIAAHSAKTDAIFINRAGERAYVLYAPRYGLVRDFQIGAPYLASDTCIYLDIDRLRRQARPSWIILSHVTVGKSRERTAMFLTLLGGIGKLEAVRKLRGAQLYRFEPDPRGVGVVLPAVGPVCFQARRERAFLDRVGASTGLGRVIEPDRASEAGATSE